MYDIEIEVLGSINNGYRLKVNVVDLGFYMFGWTARKSDKNESGWWVQPAANNVNGTWKLTVEFNKAMPLWQELEKKCIEAVNDYESRPEEPEISEEDFTPEAISRQLDKAVDEIEQEDPHNG